MDAVWLNRAGILAEALSFLLIAPEIIGIERLKRVQAFLDGALQPVSSYFLSQGQRGRAWRERDRSLTRKTLLVSTSTERLVYFVALPLAVWTTAYFVSWIWIRSRVLDLAFLTYLVGLASALLTEVAQRDRKRTRERINAWPKPLRVLTLPFLLLGLVGGLVGVITSGIVTAPLHLSVPIVRLLQGPAILRSVVFSSGVVLLAGGMAAQFVATF